MRPGAHFALHHARAAELRAEANTYHLAAVARRHRDLRARLGWALEQLTGECRFRDRTG